MPPIIRSDAHTPRAYQEAIVKDAVNKNTLVVLPTGLGKTLVSALVCAKILETEPEMKVLMMAPTRPLVIQHRESFLEILDLDEDDLIVMTGHTPPSAREEQWQEGRVFFTTPQIVENDIKKGRLTLENFGLVVFDEAHRAVKDYAYTGIAHHYMEMGAYPIILGLTASPGGNKVRVMSVCENLSIERLFYRTHDDEDVSPYVHEINTIWKEVDLPDEYRTISRFLGKMLDTRVRKLRAHQSMDSNYVGKRQLLALGQNLRERLARVNKSEKGVIFASMVLQSSALSILHATELLQSQGIRPLLRFLNRIEDEKDDRRAYKNIIKDPHYDQMKIKVIENIDIEHPKVEVLKLEIIRQIGRSATSKALVFTQYRDTASLLVNSLRNDVFVVERFVGQTSKVGDEGLNQRQQHEVLERFRRGDITVLVATSVAEEGLDIPDVDLVVFYEPIPSEIRFIQRRGRTGRKNLGRVAILATRDSIDTAYHFASQRKIKKMRELMTNIDTTLRTVRRGPRPAPRKSIKDKGPARSLKTGGPRTRPKPAGRKPTITPPTPPTEQEVVREWLLGFLDKKGKAFIEDLFDEGIVVGLDRRLLRRTLDGLLAEGLLFKPSWDLVKRVKQGSTKGTIGAKVLKVYQGGARLELEDGKVVTLYPEDFPEGPSNLKKGRSLKVRGEIFEVNGKPHIRIFELVE